MWPPFSRTAARRASAVTSSCYVDETDSKQTQLACPGITNKLTAMNHINLVSFTV
jgi:hypothetical protein